MPRTVLLTWKRKTRTIIHINRHIIASNAKGGEHQPTFLVRQGRSGKSIRARGVYIKGDSWLVDTADPLSKQRPLSCGARVWIETVSDVLLTDVVHG